MGKKIFIIMAFIMAIPLFCRADEISLTLDEAITIALRDNRDILLKTEDLKKAKLSIAEAQAGLFPAATLSGGWSDTRGLYSKDVGAYAGQAQVKQVLYTGGRVMNAVKAGEYAFTASEAKLDKTKQDVVYSVKQSYYTLLLTRELAAVNKGILDNTREHADLIQARFKAGESSTSDVLAIKSAQAGVAQAYEAAQSQTEAAAVLLRTLLYLDDKIIIRPAAQFNYEAQEVEYDAAFLKAMQARPEIKQLEAQRNAALKNIEIAKALNRPTVYASWDYYTRSTTLSGTSKNWNDYNVIGITVTWPVFDGWLTKAKVDQAIVDLKETELLRNKAGKDIALDVKRAYLDLKDALEKIKSIAEDVSVYKDHAATIQKQYDSGMASLLALHDAGLSYSIALFNQSQAIYDYKIAQARFYNATGGI
jgi:outer membrane protein